MQIMVAVTTASSTLQSLISTKSPPLKILQHIQDHKLHAPDVVLTHAIPLLKTKVPPATHLSLLEQIIIAALHTKDIQLAGEYLTQVKAKVSGTSLRYRKLLALCLESHSEYDDALAIYNDMISDNKSNVYALKRKYTILRAQLKDLESRQCLNDYLEQNASDAAGWLEMAKCCLEQADYKGAAFCYEELVLFSPMDAKIHCLLAELYVTIGGKENFVFARKHFAQCLELDKGYVRAMFGLVSAAEGYLDLMQKSIEKGGNKKNKDAWDEEDVELVRDLKSYGVKHLIKSYKGTSLSGLVESILSNDES
jgi:cytochrome c-type biogenesis protein CcmH/NrfG